jgi:anti-sigma factor RsiW
MSCSPFDLRDYFLKELAEPDRRQMEGHLKGCEACREELGRLRLTETALLSVRDEEIPRRIAFVSDKIFEPSPVRRWWQAFWTSGPRLGFTSAAMLSAAILVFSFARPTPAPAPASGGAAAMSAASLDAEFDRRVAEAVRRATADIEERHAKKTAEAVAAIEKRNEIDRQALMLAMEKNFDYVSKRLSRFTIAAAGYGPPRAGEGDTQ